MNKLLLVLLATMLISCTQKEYTNKEQVINCMTKVANYQLAHPSHHYNENDKYNYPNGWIPSTFYVSLIPLYEATGDNKYINAVRSWGKYSNWQCAPRFRHADDIVCGQIYLDLYRHEKESSYLKPLLSRMDSLVNSARPGHEDWYWCDALFMAPPVYAMAGSILDSMKYQTYANEMYWDVYDFLFDKEEALFFRDENYFNKKSPNGEKIFWGRGNGWVIGGLARLIPYVKDNTAKQRYIDLFKVMANRIVSLQQLDGLWRSNLLDSEHFPQKETSGSAFYLYALAWGVNNGILDAEVFQPVIFNGWNSLCNCIDEETGMLGWVQPIGAAPGDTKSTTTMSYGAGAFILAGTEILKMVD